MFPIGLVAGSGWASGLNVWAVVSALGIAGRMGWADSPAFLQRTPVIVVAAALYAAEFVIDKIPYVDSVWDSVNTAIRPVGAAVIALLLSSHASGAQQAASMIGAAGAALSSHSAKASLRALINVSPEPFTNIAASLGEDSAAFAVVALALRHPGAAFVVALLATILCAWLAWRFVRALRRSGERMRRRFARLDGPSARPGTPSARR